MFAEVKEQGPESHFLIDRPSSFLQPINWPFKKMHAKSTHTGFSFQTRKMQHLLYTVYGPSPPLKCDAKVILQASKL